MSELAKSKRVNDILFGPLERPALKWLSEHVPAWMTPDVLTGIGLLGSVISFTGYVLSGLDKNFLWLAIFGFVVNWFGDSLDGTVARYRHIERPRYGFVVDHLTDVFAGVLVVLGMGLSPYVNFTVATMALIAYLMTSVLVYVLTIANGVFRISSGKFGPTEVRVMMVLATLAAFVYSKPLFTASFGPVTVFTVLIGLLGLILLVLFFINAIQEMVKFSRLDAEALLAKNEAAAAVEVAPQLVKAKKSKRVREKRRRAAKAVRRGTLALAVKGGSAPR